jgi:hypothetical protein
MILRIKTRLDSGEEKPSRVYTLFFNGLWVTLASYKGKSIGDWGAVSLHDAGQNHLVACLEVKKRIANEHKEADGTTGSGNLY